MQGKVYVWFVLVLAAIYPLLAAHFDSEDEDRRDRERQESLDRRHELLEDLGKLNGSLENRTTETVSTKDLQDTLEMISQLNSEVFLLQLEAGRDTLFRRIDYGGYGIILLVLMALAFRDVAGQPRAEPETVKAKSEITRLNAELQDGLDQANQNKAR